MVLRIEALRERLAKLEDVVGRVHGYLGIDAEKVFSALQQSPRDFTDFEAEILSWLDRRAQQDG